MARSTHTLTLKRSLASQPLRFNRSWSTYLLLEIATCLCMSLISISRSKLPSSKLKFFKFWPTTKISMMWRQDHSQRLNNLFLIKWNCISCLRSFIMALLHRVSILKKRHRGFSLTLGMKWKKCTRETSNLCLSKQISRETVSISSLSLKFRLF
jgi:hypothetical protein